jgi:hypothetical protein
VLWESHRVRRTELGRIGRLGRLWLEIKRIFRNPAPQEIGPLSASATSSAGIAEITVRGAETPLQEVQRRVGELEDALLRTREQLDSEAQNLRWGLPLRRHVLHSTYGDE